MLQNRVFPTPNSSGIGQSPTIHQQQRSPVGFVKPLRSHFGLPVAGSKMIFERSRRCSSTVVPSSNTTLVRCIFAGSLEVQKRLDVLLVERDSRRCVVRQWAELSLVRRRASCEVRLDAALQSGHVGCRRCGRHGRWRSVRLVDRLCISERHDRDLHYVRQS